MSQVVCGVLDQYPPVLILVVHGYCKFEPRMAGGGPCVYRGPIAVCRVKALPKSRHVAIRSQLFHEQCADERVWVTDVTNLIDRCTSRRVCAHIGYLVTN